MKQLKDSRSFVKKKAAQVRQLDLSALLIMPIQRLPRYELLLSELVKNTSENHSDFASLSEALKYIREVNLYINQRQKKDDERLQVMELIAKQNHKIEKKKAN